MLSFNVRFFGFTFSNWVLFPKPKGQSAETQFDFNDVKFTVDCVPHYV